VSEYPPLPQETQERVENLIMTIESWDPPEVFDMKIFKSITKQYEDSKSLSHKQIGYLQMVVDKWVKRSTKS
jgi:hypothetical protein